MLLWLLMIVLLSFSFCGCRCGCRVVVCLKKMHWPFCFPFATTTTTHHPPPPQRRHLFYGHHLWEWANSKFHSFFYLWVARWSGLFNAFWCQTRILWKVGRKAMERSHQRMGAQSRFNGLLLFSLHRCFVWTRRKFVQFKQTRPFYCWYIGVFKRSVLHASGRWKHVSQSDFVQFIKQIN